MFEQIQSLVSEHGQWFYLITFVWAFFEGETFLIFAGFFASQDFLSLPMLILMAGIGTTFGDFFFFMLGRRYGSKLVAKMPKLAKGQEKVATWMLKNDVGFILTYRYIYGLRNVSAIAIGMSPISARRFFALNACGAFVWAVSFACGGYLFGHLLVKEGDNPIVAIMQGVLGIFIVVLIIRYLVNRRAAQQQVQAEASKISASPSDPSPRD